MPYISPSARKMLGDFGSPADAGELNYAITKLVLEFLGSAPRYQDFNDALGALEGAKLELYRRRIAPYEDGKAAENGDVYA